MCKTIVALPHAQRLRNKRTGERNPVTVNQNKKKIIIHESVDVYNPQNTDIINWQWIFNCW